MIEIAKIVKPQGIKGEVKALSYTNVVKVFDVMTECLVGDKVMHIKHTSFRQGFLYIKFEEINTRNDAELLRNKLIKIDKELLENAKEEEEFLVDDLVGMVVYDEKGDLVGQILDIVNYGASDILIMECNGRKYEVPYVKDVFKRNGARLVADSKKLLEVRI